MTIKKQKIRRMLLNEYGYPALQQLIAELVYETSKFNGSDLNKRFETVMRALFGTPKNARENGYIDDTKLLMRVAMVIKMGDLSKASSIKTRSYGAIDKASKEWRPLTIEEACLEIAKVEKIKGYKFNSHQMSEITDGEKAEIKALKKRLQSKLSKNNIDYYARAYKEASIKDIIFEELELSFIKSLIPDWLEAYGRQITFEKKSLKK